LNTPSNSNFAGFTGHPVLFTREDELLVMSEANTAAREINKDKQVLGEKHVKDDEKVRQ